MVGTPRTPDMYAPQLFHGTSGDVTVPESSTVRDSIRGASPPRAKASLQARLGSTSDPYWSPAITFNPKHVPTTVAISHPADFARATTGEMSRSRKPAASMTAAKLSAPKISHTVVNIETM